MDISTAITTNGELWLTTLCLLIAGEDIVLIDLCDILVYVITILTIYCISFQKALHSAANILISREARLQGR